MSGEGTNRSESVGAEDSHTRLTTSTVSFAGGRFRLIDAVVAVVVSIVGMLLILLAGTVATDGSFLSSLLIEFGAACFLFIPLYGVERIFERTFDERSRMIDRAYSLGRGDERADEDDGWKRPLESEELAELRRKNGVRRVQGLETGDRLRQLPPGRYGFTVPWGIEWVRNGEDQLSSSSGGTAVLEVHKTSRGDIHLVVFTKKGDAKRVQSTGKRTIIGCPQPVPSEGFDVPVSLPVTWIVSAEDRSFEPTPDEHAYLLQLTLK
jgi:hypothetical protein